MATARRDQIIELLDCEIDVRPADAPSVDRLLPHVLSIARTAEALVVEFDQQSAQMLEAFIEAERLCCADIGWEIERQPGLRLRITANDDQLKAIESLWNSNQT